MKSPEEFDYGEWTVRDSEKFSGNVEIDVKNANEGFCFDLPAINALELAEEIRKQAEIIIYRSNS